jgi:hypothetical protein
VEFDDTVSVKLPSTLAMVPLVVPFSIMLAPGSGSLFSSTILPFTVIQPVERMLPMWQQQSHQYDI